MALRDLILLAILVLPLAGPSEHGKTGRLAGAACEVVVSSSDGFRQYRSQGLEAFGVAKIAQMVAGDGTDVERLLPAGWDVFHARDRDGDVVFLVEEERVSHLVKEFGRGQTSSADAPADFALSPFADSAADGMIDVLPASMT